ncbi:MAG: neutral/alkaline non-lysosomal ceramidase N-terminal domain-containing protein [Verrucomicrobiota bacterium]
MKPRPSLTRRGFATVLIGVAAGLTAFAAAPAPVAKPDLPWRVGAASRQITPTGPIWLAGYASRSAPSDGVDSDLFAKALALDDTQGGRVVLVTLDLIRVPKALRDFVETEAATRFGLKPAELLLNSSHTHSGPELEPDRMVLETVFSRMAKPADIAALHAYQEFLRRSILEVIGASLQAAAPAKLDYSHGRAGFAMNRRRPEAKGAISNNPYPDGPVDHDVPVLKVTGPDGKVRALLFGYACHNTTLGGTKVSGDYAGHAQQYLESSYPGAVALYVQGCAGDQNPYPRGKVAPGQADEESARQHGRALANAVHTALAARLRPITGPLKTALGSALLDYDPPTPAELAKFTGPAFTPPVLERARTLAQRLQRGEKLAPLACPVQVLHFGTALTLVAIGGEVTVDYSLRLKRELQGEGAVWVAGYSNNVFGYLGSRRVIEEGGYEGGGANTRILNHPGNLARDTEDRVVAKVHELVRGGR